MGRVTVLLICILAPLAGAFLMPLLGRSRPGCATGAPLPWCSSSLVCALLLVPDAVAGRTVTFAIGGPLGISFSLLADGLAVFMAVVSSLVGALIMLFSFDYISHYDNQNEYYLMAVLFLGAMMGLVFSANLIFLYVFWEITGDRQLAPDRLLPRQERRAAGRQGVPGHRLRRPGHAGRHHRRLRPGRHLRPGRR